MSNLQKDEEMLLPWLSEEQVERCKDRLKGRWQQMKAYIARNKYENFSTVVFAETAGKARSIAMHTDACCDAEFTDIEVRRCPKADSQYDGGSEMDWENPKHRLFLVSECGFSCEDPDYRFCKSCIAKEKCDTYQEYLAEEGDNNG